MASYPRERQIETWISDQIVGTLRRAGFKVAQYPIEMLVERRLPADFIFLVSVATAKIFGLQYKALHRNRADGWRLTRRQHGTLRRYPWIFYALSQLRNPAERRFALRTVCIVSAVDIPWPKGRWKSIYVRSTALRHAQDWPSLLKAFRRCRAGVRAGSLRRLRRMVPPRVAKELYELYVVDIRRRKAARLTKKRRGPLSPGLEKLNLSRRPDLKTRGSTHAAVSA